MTEEASKESPPEATESTEIDAKATDMGWVPQDQWKGNPDQWRPAEEFVKRGENILPIVKDRLKKVEDELKASLAINKKEIQAIKDAAYEKATAEYEAKLAKLDKEEIDAFQDADAEKFQEVKKKRETLKAPVKPVVEEAPAANPEFVEWESKNSWYQDDAVLRRNADVIAEEVWNANPGLTAKALYAKVEAQIKEEFSHKFTNPKREEAPSVEGGGDSPPKVAGKFSDLPDSAKKTYERLAAKAKLAGREFSKEAYVEAYNE